LNVFEEYWDANISDITKLKY